jgi:heme-degrading monooxygenase HmoA
MSVTLINLFDVPAGLDADFQRLWRQVNEHMRVQPGYLEHTLHQALTPDARYRFVNVARWRSEDEFRAAHGPEFRALVAQPGWEKFPPQPALYQVVNHATADGSPA